MNLFTVLARAARVRGFVIAIATSWALLAAAPAAAHPRSPAIALDYRVALSQASRALPGVHVRLFDGGRWIRATVDPSQVLVVRGSLGEPVLRFASDGVWVDTRSPTAAADRIVGPGTTPSGWLRLTSGHTYAWHDHRLAPPRGSGAGFAGEFTLPVTLDGRPTAITGMFWRVRRPQFALWVGLAALAGGALALVAHRLAKRKRISFAAYVAGFGAVVGLGMETAFALAEPLGAGRRWSEVTAAAVLVVAVAAAMLIRSPAGRRWVALAVGVYAALMGLDSASTFWHGAVISSWPAPAVRTAAAATLACGCVAAALAFFTDEDDVSPGRLR